MSLDSEKLSEVFMKFGMKNMPVIFLWCGLIEFVGEEESFIGNSQISDNNKFSDIPTH